MGAGIDAIVPRSGTTQAEAARLLGPSQPDVYRPLKGDWREHSLELLFRMIAVLGRDIVIVIRWPRWSAGPPSFGTGIGSGRISGPPW